MVLKASYAVLPADVVTNSRLCETHGLESPDALARMGGVQERRYWPRFESLVGLSGLAARGALASLDTVHSGSSLSTLIHCTTTPDSCSPAMAHRLHRALELGHATQCFDVSSSCTSVLSALRIANSFAAASENSDELSLIVAAEAKSRHIAHGDARTVSLFGDAAVALSVGANRNGFVWLEPFVDSSLVDNIRVTAGDASPWTKDHAPTETKNHAPALVMTNGRLMYRRTVAAFVTMIERALVQARQMDLAVHRVFVHQANANLLRDVKSHFPNLFVPVLMSDVGNLVSASLPIHRVRALILEGIANWWRSQAAGHGQGDIAAYRDDVLTRLARHYSRSSTHSNQDSTFQISARYGAEVLTLEDCAATGVMDSWLRRVSDAEWECFFGEHSFFAKSKDDLQASGKRGSCDVWIGAGGGFQALGALHVLPEQFGISFSSLITGEDSGH
jgi:3-oxoacyl-[acyl-carrier-protein] synthase III